ncbi:MAG: aminotransferase class I/II-fold pyridoxal phosphate-dependent enzyme [Acidobacteriota bacterium]
MDLLEKLRPAARLLAECDPVTRPFGAVVEEVLGPGEVRMSGRRTLMLGANNYLGLTRHPEVIAAARDALSRYGSGTTGSRVANGTLALHAELEEDLARFLGKRVAMIFTTGHQANLSVLAGLSGRDDTILLDAESHASLHDGARLSGATVLAFRHSSAEDLAKKLDRLPRGERNRLVVVEGLYSIRGDVAPLAEIAAVCHDRGAYLMVDEAHSFGVYGERGRGACEAAGVLAEVDFLVGTFSKALGGIGGFVVSDHPEVAALRVTARAYVFTASGSPANVAGVRAALAIVARDASLCEKLWENARRLRSGLRDLGYEVRAEDAPIVAVLVGGAERTLALWQKLLDAGVYVNVVLPPGCARNECQLRASVSAAHDAGQIDEALAAFAKVRA